jgi:hypothetical protein
LTCKVAAYGTAHFNRRRRRLLAARLLELQAAGVVVVPSELQRFAGRHFGATPSRTAVPRLQGQLTGAQHLDLEVANGSRAGLREITLGAVDLPVEPNRQIHGVRRQ